MTDVVMPRLSDTMEEGTVLRWLKRDGEHVARGEGLVEIETDKASMTYESDREGTLETVAREGDTLAVGELIARIGAMTAEEGAPSSADGPPSNADGALATEDGEPPASDGEPPASVAEPPIESGRPAPPPERPEGERVKASPLARRIAREAGVELRSVSGSGPGGRIVKADVEAAVGAPGPMAEPSGGVGTAQETVGTSAPRRSGTAPAEQAATATPSTPTVAEVASAKGKTTTADLSRTQRTIARRMAESKATIPDFALTVDVDMERCAQLREELKRLAQAPSGDGTRAPTYNDMIVKACALALREHPRANGSYRDGRFELHARVNVGVAVAVDSDDPMASALVVPTVFDADTKALGEIARETRTLAERVRAGTITPPELSGATFSVSNLGMYGIAQFTAIVNPPQAAILAVGTVRPQAVVAGASVSAAVASQTNADRQESLDRPADIERKTSAGVEVAVRHTMRTTLTCDHRILYGADAALFLARIQGLLEEPAALTL